MKKGGVVPLVALGLVILLFIGLVWATNAANNRTLTNIQASAISVAANRTALAVTRTTVAINKTSVAATGIAVAASETSVSATGTTVAATATVEQYIATVQAGSIDATATAVTIYGEYIVTDQSNKRMIHEGQTFSVSFTLQNVGLNVWSMDNGYQLQCINDKDAIPCTSSHVDWCSSTPMVRPTQACEIIVTMQAPTQTGTYKTIWQLQHNNKSVAAAMNPYMFIEITVVQ